MSIFDAVIGQIRGELSSYTASQDGDKLGHAQRLGSKCGKAALARLLAEAGGSDPYHIALIDHIMPDMDGYEATRNIRAIEDELGCSARTTIIALTAHAFAEDKQHSLEAGMDDLLCKPVTGSKMEAMVKQWLPAKKQQAGAAVLDAATWQSLCENMGDGMDEIVEIYVRELPAQIEIICLALQKKNVGSLKNATHRLKGTSQNIGALALAGLCEQLDAKVGDMDALEVSSMIQTLNNGRDALLQALNVARVEGSR